MQLSYKTVDHLCKKFDTTRDPVDVDLSGITFLRPFGILYLGLFLRHMNSNGKACNVGIPRNPAARRYLASQNFWERFNFNKAVIKEENLHRFSNSTSLNDIVDIENRPYIAEEIADGVKRVLRMKRVSVNTSEIENIVAELVDNFVRHSRDTLAAFHMQYYPNINELVLAVGDCGIGIRASLSNNPEYSTVINMPHNEAALLAFKIGVTGSNEGGMGLTETKETVQKLGGTMILTTGDGYVKIDKHQIQLGEMAFDLPGVQIELSFPEV